MPNDEKKHEAQVQAHAQAQAQDDATETETSRSAELDFEELDLTVEHVEERISPGETNVFDK
ncbi:MAG: hypothetical protein GY711_10895 [bacterium]|nr:hypothetical protein [bacterium]